MSVRPGSLTPCQIEGTLAYISNGNAWVMRGVSTNKRLLTTSGDLDNRVFTLTPDGRQLLVQPQIVRSDHLFQPTLDDQRHDQRQRRADQCCARKTCFMPIGFPIKRTRSAIRAAKSPTTAPAGRHINDLWIMRIDPNTGDSLNARQLVDRSSGWLYSWWGTGFQWSPDGQKLAWVRADSMGLVDTDTGEFQTLLTYPVFSTRQPWSWRATVSWSPDDSLILTTVHGLPIGSEPAETSPAFHDAVTGVERHVQRRCRRRTRASGRSRNIRR